MCAQLCSHYRNQWTTITLCISKIKQNDYSGGGGGGGDYTKYKIKEETIK